MPGGVRYHANGVSRTARLNEGLLVFWTPRLSPWVLGQAKKAELKPELPAGVRLWEQWSLVSREALDPGVIGVFRDMAVWAEVEGLPRPETHRIDSLAVLRAGALVPLETINSPEGGLSWASAESFSAISELCHHFLKWDRFSVRSVRARAIFEWEQRRTWRLARAGDDRSVFVVPACDGPLAEVARNARAACVDLSTQIAGRALRTSVPKPQATGGEAP
jgi:hypothetical protein